MFSRFNKFFKYFGQGYQFKLFYMLLLSFLSTLLEFLSIVLVFPFIMIMVNPSRVLYNPIAIYFKEQFHIEGINNMILFFGGLITGAIIIKNLFAIFIQYLQNKMVNQWGLEVKEKYLTFFLYSPYEADLQRGTNNIITRITTDVDTVMQYFISKVISIISNSFLIVLVFAALMFLLPMHTTIAIFFFSIAGIIQSNVFKNFGTKLSIKKHNLTNGAYSSVINSLTCIKDIKINGCQKYFYNLYLNISEKIIPFNEKINLLPLIPQHLLEIIFIITMTIVCIGILYQYGQNPQNVVVSMGVLAIAIYRVVPQVYKNQVYMNYVNINKPKIDVLFNLYEKYSMYEYSKNRDTKERMSFKNELVVKNMSYSYDKKEKVLTNINLNIKKGEFIGIVGLSGAGKSTLVDCLLGLLEYDGHIFVDDECLNTDNLQKFRNIIGYVPQKTCTIEGDIYANVAWGVERKDINKEKVDEVLKTAQLYDQLKQTENGLEIELKQDGTGLSGGQMQRIGIARALYRDPEIIVLDEATANLDVKIENKLTDILSELKGNKTIIAIAHRLSTLVHCDRIAFMKDGTIVGVGTFQELSEKFSDFEEIVRLSRIKLDDEKN